MIDLQRSWLPGGQPWITARLRCDGCGRLGAGPLGSDNPASVFILRCRLRKSAREHDGWASATSIAAGDLGASHKVDYCPGCRSVTPGRRPRTR